MPFQDAAGSLTSERPSLPPNGCSAAQLAAIGGAILLLFFISCPLNFIHGTLVAEEGSTYLRYARAVPFWTALLAPHQGYYTLFPNIATILPARYVSLASAPLVAMWTTVSVRLFLAMIIASSDLFRSPYARLLAGASMVITVGSPNCLGTTCLQFFLAAAGAVVLLSDPSAHRFARTLCLLLLGLNGPSVCFLVPFFLFAAWKRKNGTSWIHAVIVVICAGMQVLVFRAALPFSARNTHSLGPWWSYPDSLFTHILLAPALTREALHLVYVAVTHPGSHLGSIMSIFAVLAMLGFLALIWSGGAEAVVLVVFGMLSALASVLGGLGGDRVALVGNGDRYFLTGAICFFLSLIVAMERPATRSQPWRRTTIKFLLAASCISGMVDIVHFAKPMQAPIAWTKQIAEWRLDPSRELFNGPPIWFANTYRLPPSPQSLALPYYIFDSSIRLDVTSKLKEQFSDVVW